MLKAWKKPGDKTKYAKFYANDSNWGNDNYNRRATNTFTYKGDYLCLREITLQYSLPSKLFTKVGLKGVTLTVSGNNLCYFTEVKGHFARNGVVNDLRRRRILQLSPDPPFLVRRTSDLLINLKQEPT